MFLYIFIFVHTFICVLSVRDQESFDTTLSIRFNGQGQSVLGHGIFIVQCRSGTGRLLEVGYAWPKGYSATQFSLSHLSLSIE